MFEWLLDLKISIILFGKINKTVYIVHLFHFSNPFPKSGHEYIYQQNFKSIALFILRYFHYFSKKNHNRFPLSL